MAKKSANDLWEEDKKIKVNKENWSQAISLYKFILPYKYHFIGGLRYGDSLLTFSSSSGAFDEILSSIIEQAVKAKIPLCYISADKSLHKLFPQDEHRLRIFHNMKQSKPTMIREQHMCLFPGKQKMPMILKFTPVPYLSIGMKGGG